MKSVLITGGAGFVPSCLADALLKTGQYTVVAVDNFITGKRDYLSTHPDYNFIEGDINSFHEIRPMLEKFHFDYIFHYAALVGVARTTDNPKMVLDDILGLQQVFEFAKEKKVKRIFFSSSSEVYGEPVHLPQHEYDTPLNSRLPYAVVKNLGECFCKAYQKEFGLDYTIFRFFNTYGPRQSDDFVIAKFLNAANEGKNITIYGDGSQSRTFCFIEDNIEFTLKVLRDNLFNNGVVNVGDDRLVTINELAKTIIKLTGANTKIINLPPLKEGDMSRRQPDNTKMKATLGRDLISLEDGIKRIIAKRLSTV